jgi:uncharacterized membrane protein YgcG
MRWARILRHLLTNRWTVRRRFPPDVLRQIEAAIGEVEARHAGEIRFVVEGALDLPELVRDEPARARSIELFARLGVWDTAENNGVLIHVLLADRDVEIVADRGIAGRVPQEDWERVCRDMEGHYRQGRFAEGSVAGIRGVGSLLSKHFPGGRPDADELPNQPVLL